MTMTAAIVAVVISGLLLAMAIAVLVLLRRGDGPVYSASRAYDANRREAVRLLLGEDVEAVRAEQWFERARREPLAADPLERPYQEAVAEALRAVVPADRGLVIEPPGRVAIEGAVVTAPISTADLRASGELDDWDGASLWIGIVLVNPEPPGGDARRVTLPIQILFPALERAGRGDLVRRFTELREHLAARPDTAEVA